MNDEAFLQWWTPIRNLIDCGEGTLTMTPQALTASMQPFLHRAFIEGTQQGEKTRTQNARSKSSQRTTHKKRKTTR